VLPIFDRAEALVTSSDCLPAAPEIASLPDRCFVPARALTYRNDVNVWHPRTQWLRFVAPETSARDVAWVLVVSTYVTSGELVLVAPGGRVIEDRSFGSEIPVSDRPIFSHDIDVPVVRNVPMGTRFLLEYTSPYSVPDLQLQTAASIQAADMATSHHAAFIFAFLNGGALTMALFNIVLFALLRRSIYLIYAAAISALVFYQIVEVGTAWTLLWPHLGLRDDYPSYLIWIVYVALIVVFARRMLNLPTVAPWMDRALFVVFGIVVLDSLAYVVFPDPLLAAGLYNWLDPLVTATMVGTMLVAGLVAWRRGVSGATAYVIAFAGSAVGIVASDIAFYDPAFAAYPEMAYLPLSYGVAWESVFLAAALGQRVRDTEREAERLSEYAFRDGLTGIANRRAFDAAIEREWTRLQRTSAMLAVIIFDIDQFKDYNDRFGHPAGDERLKVVASIIGAAARRQDDLAARYGGEEFALLLPNTSVEAAYAIAEDVRRRVPSAGEGPLTVSAGVAATTATSDAKQRHALVAAADAALYAAKKAGRDRTETRSLVFGGTGARPGGG
jgi:diguanylate cyclase (GGDEF)-like protein